MDEGQLASLETLAKAASPGPWAQDGFDVQTNLGEGKKRDDRCVCRCNAENEGTGGLPEKDQYNNAAFIAAMNPSVALELIQQVRKDREDVQHLLAERAVARQTGKWTSLNSFVKKRVQICVAESCS